MALTVLVCASVIAARGRLFAQDQTVERRYTYDEVGNRIAATNQIRFTSPAIFAVQPRVARPGDRANIFGRNFPAGKNSVVSVTINGTPIKVLSVATRVITIEIPAEATTGPLLLSLPGLGQAPGGDFVVTAEATVSPNSVEIHVGEEIQFRATFQDRRTTSVRWDVNRVRGGNATFGTISAGGLYKAPAATSDGDFPITVRAVSEQTGAAATAIVQAKCATLTPIMYGDLAAGQLSSAQGRLCYDLEGVSGEVVTVVLTSSSRSRLWLRGPKGLLLGKDGPGNALAVSNVRLSEAGRYRIELLSEEETQGNYGLGVRRLGDGVPIALNTPTAGDIARFGQVDAYTFQANAGATVSLQFTTPHPGGGPDLFPDLELISPSGTVVIDLPAQGSCGANLAVDRLPLTESGTWTVQVHSDWQCRNGDFNVLTGAYSLLVCPSNTVPIPIAYGEASIGRFSVDCQVFNYEFVGQAGDLVTVKYAGEIISTDVYLERLRLFSPSGATVLESAGNFIEIEDFSLPATGTYRVTLEARSGRTGRFGFAVDKPPVPVPIALNTPTAGDIARFGQVDAYTFQANAGATVSLQFTTPHPGGGPDLFPDLELISPSGTVVIDLPAQGSCGANLAVDRLPLTESGTWTVQVHSDWQCRNGDFNVLTGAYSLLVCPSNTVPIPIAYGEASIGRFSVDCQVFNYEFVGQAGDLVTVKYAGEIISTDVYLERLRLFSPSGATVLESAGNFIEIEDFSLPATGTYRVTLEARSGRTGRFGFAVDKPPVPVPIALNTPTAGDIARFGQVDAYTFQANAGATVSLQFTTPHPGGGPDLFPDLELISPSGTVVIDLPAQGSCGANLAVDRLPLTESGTWTVQVHSDWQCRNGDFNVLTGAYSLQVTVDAGAGGFGPGGRDSAQGVQFSFLRADANHDGRIRLDDAVLVLRILYLGASPPLCKKALDATDDGRVDVSDPMRILHHLFGGQTIPGPYPNCGPDLTLDQLGCEEFIACP